MTTAVFDTLKASRKLKAAGIEEAQAEAIVQSMAEAFRRFRRDQGRPQGSDRGSQSRHAQDRHCCRSRKRQPHRRSD